MRSAQVRALCGKEWQVFSETPLGYVIAVAFLLASGFFFANQLFLVGQADMRGWFSVLSLLLMFFIPAISMRMLSGEQRSGTFELLASMPVRSIDIVVGKYLALWLQMTVLLLFTCLYPLSLLLLGNPDMGQILASYLAAILLASSYIAVCLYASALTRHEVVAYVLGFMMLLVMFLLTQAMRGFSVDWQNALMVLSPLAHYQSMLRGLVQWGDVVFFVAMTTFFLTLTWFELQRRRWR